jgi:hypothetical protein
LCMKERVHETRQKLQARITLRTILCPEMEVIKIKSLVCFDFSHKKS